MLPEYLRVAKYDEIARLQVLADDDMLPEAQTAPRPDFRAALRRRAGHTLPVIAEYKRASPSRGVINDRLTPEEVAAQYTDAGAACVSVLTEESWFKGHMDFLHRMTGPCGHLTGTGQGVPLLRKDFLFHPLQVLATAASPASALLLIVRLTPSVVVLRDLREQAEQYGMDAVVEIFDAHELDMARESGARIIQVNARDLSTMKVDRTACLQLGAQRHCGGRDELWVAASGLETPHHLRDAAEAGYDAALVGTALMRDNAPGAALRRLLGDGAPAEEARA